MRVTFDKNGNISQEDSYYPFGMSIKSLSHTTLTDNQKNKYLYNGKEFDEDFGLNWYDYGARFYDAELGRWHVVDPLAEKYLSQSPYHFSGNNPIYFVDANGMEFDPAAEKAANAVKTEASEEIKTLTDRINRRRKRKWFKFSGREQALLDKVSNYKEVINEIRILKKSSQMYSIQTSTNLPKNENGDQSDAITVFDFDTEQVVMKVKPNESRNALFAHEFKHMFQFETGQLDLTEKGSNPDFLNDKFIEQEAYTRQNLFEGKYSLGKPIISKINLHHKIIGNKHASAAMRMLMGSKHNTAIRYNGQTYNTKRRENVNESLKHYYNNFGLR